MEGIFLINLYIQLEKLNKHLNYWVMMNRKNSFLILKKNQNCFAFHWAFISNFKYISKLKI